MPRRISLTPDQEETLWRLHLQKVPMNQAAQLIGCHRQTAARAIDRRKRSLAQAHQEDFEAARALLLAELDLVKRDAWMSKAGCQPGSNAAVGYLGIVLDATKQQASMLGLEAASWINELVRLVEDDSMRCRMGGEALTFASTRSIDVWAPQWMEVHREAARREAMSWAA
jgi:predicted DNA-binding protein (UPF0251 family)